MFQSRTKKKILEDQYVYTGVNMSVIVSVRLDEEDLDAVENLGLRPGPLMRVLLKKEIRKRKALEAIDQLDKMKVKPVESVVDTIRKDRDTR